MMASSDSERSAASLGSAPSVAVAAAEVEIEAASLDQTIEQSVSVGEKLARLGQEREG